MFRFGRLRTQGGGAQLQHSALPLTTSASILPLATSPMIPPSAPSQFQQQSRAAGNRRVEWAQGRAHRAHQRATEVSARLHPTIRKVLHRIGAQPHRGGLREQSKYPMPTEAMLTIMTATQRIDFWRTVNSLNLKRMEALRLKAVAPDHQQSQHQQHHQQKQQTSSKRQSNGKKNKKTMARMLGKERGVGKKKVVIVPPSVSRSSARGQPSLEQQDLFAAALFQHTVGGVWRWEAPKNSKFATAEMVDDSGTCFSSSPRSRRKDPSSPTNRGRKSTIPTWMPECLSAAHTLWEKSIEASGSVLSGRLDSPYWELNSVSDLSLWRSEVTPAANNGPAGCLRRLTRQYEDSDDSRWRGVPIRVLFQILHRHHPAFLEESNCGLQLEALGKVWQQTSHRMLWAIRKVFINHSKIRHAVLESCAEEAVFRWKLNKLVAYSPEVRLLRGGYKSMMMTRLADYRFAQCPVCKLLIPSLVKQRQLEFINRPKPTELEEGKGKLKNGGTERILSPHFKRKAEVLAAYKASVESRAGMGAHIRKLRLAHGFKILRWESPARGRSTTGDIYGEVSRKFRALSKPEQQKLDIVTPFQTKVDAAPISGSDRHRQSTMLMDFFTSEYEPQESTRFRAEYPGIDQEELTNRVLSKYVDFRRFFVANLSEEKANMLSKLRADLIALRQVASDEGADAEAAIPAGEGHVGEVRISRRLLSQRKLYTELVSRWMHMSRDEQLRFSKGFKEEFLHAKKKFPLFAGDDAHVPTYTSKPKEAASIGLDDLLQGDGPSLFDRSE